MLLHAKKIEKIRLKIEELEQKISLKKRGPAKAESKKMLQLNSELAHLLGQKYIKRKTKERHENTNYLNPLYDICLWPKNCWITVNHCHELESHFSKNDRKSTDEEEFVAKLFGGAVQGNSAPYDVRLNKYPTYVEVKRQSPDGRIIVQTNAIEKLTYLIEQIKTKLHEYIHHNNFIKEVYEDAIKLKSFTPLHFTRGFLDALDSCAYSSNDQNLSSETIINDMKLSTIGTANVYVIFDDHQKRIALIDKQDIDKFYCFTASSKHGCSYKKQMDIPEASLSVVLARY